MNCLHGCWTVDFVMVNFYHFVKNIWKGVLLHKFLVFWEKKGKQNHQYFSQKTISKKSHNCLKQHERLNCLLNDYNLSNITKWGKKKETLHWTSPCVHYTCKTYQIHTIHVTRHIIFISMHKNARLKKLFQILPTTIATNLSRFNISISNTCDHDLWY